MKILCVSAQALFPETRFGGAKRLYYLVKALEGLAEVDVIHMDGCDEVRAPEAFAPPFRRQLFLPRQTLSALELGPVIPEASKALRLHRDAISAFVGRKRYDATLLLFPSALYVLDRDLVPHPGRKVYLEDDLLFARLGEEARKETVAPARRLLKRLRQLQAGRFFRRVLRRVDRFVCISPQEAERVRALWGMPADLLGYGIPLEEYPVLAPAPRANVLGFIGNYRHTPNLDAARWLATALFPAVGARIPGARLVLAGSGFPEDLRALCARDPAIEILDEVDDLADFYGRVSLFVNPIREGRGLRTKVVEAAAYGRPVLSTRLGAEGLESLELGLFESPDDLAREVAALADGRVRGRIAARNREEVERRFSLEVVSAELYAILAGKGSA